MKKTIIITMLLIAFVLLAGLSCQNKQTAPAPQPTPPAGEPTPPAAGEEPQKNKKLDLSNKGLEKIPPRQNLRLGILPQLAKQSASESPRREILTEHVLDGACSEHVLILPPIDTT